MIDGERVFLCRDCGTSVTVGFSKGRQAMTCVPCVKKRARESARRYQARKREERKNGSVVMSSVQGSVE